MINDKLIFYKGGGGGGGGGGASKTRLAISYTALTARPGKISARVP